jgi:hypothetical protein
VLLPIVQSYNVTKIYHVVGHSSFFSHHETVVQIVRSKIVWWVSFAILLFPGRIERSEEPMGRMGKGKGSIEQVKT